jgi:hypothetical protein
MLVLSASLSVKRGWREEKRAKLKKQWAIICLSLGLVIMLTASWWRVHTQRLKGKEDVMTRIMIFFLREGLLIMLVLPLRVKKSHRGWREEKRSKLKNKVSYNLSSFRTGDNVSSLPVASASSEAGWRGGRHE